MIFDFSSGYYPLVQRRRQAKRCHRRVTYICTSLKKRVLSSSRFVRSERLAHFLRFVVERGLDGSNGGLKESLIAIEVFGRKADYDPKQDSIVRTEAGRLRARLVEYYASEGPGDTLLIELPKGGYAPVFRRIDEARVERKNPSRRLGLVAALARWHLGHKKAPIPIAVLPLQDLCQDAANEYFADGLTDELIRAAQDAKTNNVFLHVPTPWKGQPKIPRSPVLGD